MGFLRQSSNPNSYVPRYTGLQIQTSSGAVPIQIIYGTNRTAPNVIWTGGFFSVAQYQSSGGAKGGGGGNNQPTSYNYYTSLMLGVCEGHINGYRSSFTSQGQIYSIGELQFEAFGDQSQTPWGFLSSSYSSQALSYKGLAYVASANYPLGGSPVIPQFSFEIQGILPNTGIFNGYDADPARIIQDFLTSAQYGVGFPAASIDATTLLASRRTATVTMTLASPCVVTWAANGLVNGQQVAFQTTGSLYTPLAAGTLYYVVAAATNTFQIALTSGGTPINTSGTQSGTQTAETADSSYQTYCQATYLALSPVLSNQEAANSILARWLQLTNTATVWSSGKLKFIPYGDAYTRNPAIGVSFYPNVTPLYALADDDFVFEDGKDPVECVRNDPYSVSNWQRLQISQRTNYYDATPIDAWDQNAIELYGRRTAPDITANEICDRYVGQIAAQLILQRQLYIRNTYNFKLSFEYCLLEPMDLVTITDMGLGLSNVAVRITSVEEDDPGLLAVTAEEFPGGTATAVQYPVQVKSSNSTNQGVVPARVNVPFIAEPPASLTNNIANVFIAASGGVASTYLLAEDGSTGNHQTQQTVATSQAAGNTITFSIYAQAGLRIACRLNFFNGVTNVGCDFNLSAGTAGVPDAGISVGSISSAGGNWLQLTITGNMAAAAAPILFVLLENPVGTSSFAGTNGNGIYIWGAQFSAPSASPTFLPAFSTVTGATLATSGVATPEGAAGVGDPNWGGANVWLSTDGSTYGQVGQIKAPARQGFLTAALGSSSGNPDVTNTLSVSLIESGGLLATATNADARNGVTLCLVGSELLAYGTATLTGANTYNLTYLYRGLYGTTVTSHSSGAPFVRVDSAVFQYPLPPSFVGVTLYLKLQSFNIFGQAIEDLSECTVYTYTPSGASSPVGPVTNTLLLGQNLDYRLASQVVSESDNWGIASDGYIAAKVDLGLASL